MKQEKLLLIVLVLIFIYEGAVSADDESLKQHAECGVYLAESTIPGAGLGMYAGNREYKYEDTITEGDLMVPIFELDWHNGHLTYNVSTFPFFISFFTLSCYLYLIPIMFSSCGKHSFSCFLWHSLDIL
jgi:hypothetical protein